MKQSLSLLFPHQERSHKQYEEPVAQFGNNGGQSQSRHQHMISSSSQKQLTSFESPNTSFDYRYKNNGKIPKDNNNNEPPHLFGSSDRQPIHQFLTSSGEDFEHAEPYSIGDNISTHQRYTVHTHKTSSSLKNVPMCYSSTNSQGNLQGRLQQLGQFTELGSPITITEGYQDCTSERRRADFSAGTNKKSVKFEDQSESKIKIFDDSKFIGSDYHLNSQSKQYKDADTSEVIQAKINTKINQINNKYFQNNGSQNFMSNSGFQEMLPQSQTLQILDQQVNENEQSFGDQIRDDDENSIVAMEDAIEEERQRVHSDLNRKYFSNEPSIVLQQRQVPQSVNASSYSFEQLKDQVLNQQSYQQFRKQDERGTTQKLLSDLSQWQRPSVHQSINLQQDSLRNTTQKALGEQFKDQDESQNNQYQALRQSRSRSQRKMSQSSKEGTIIVESYRDYANKLKTDHKSFESKLQSLKSKIKSIHKQANEEEGPLSRQVKNNIVTTPTILHLTAKLSQLQDIPPSHQIMPTLEKEANIKTQSERLMSLSKLSTQKVKDPVKRHSVNPSGSRSRFATRNSSITNQISLSRNVLPTSSTSRNHNRLRIGMKDTLDRIQEADHNSTLTTKVKWLEKRNQEYSQRLKDLVSEKRDSKSHISDLEYKVKEMQQQLYSQGKNTRSIQMQENKRIEDLETQISELKHAINSQKQQKSEKENIHPKDNFQTIEETPTRLKSLQSISNTIPLRKAPLVPLRQSKDRKSRSPNNNNNKSVDRTRSLSKPKQRDSSTEVNNKIEKSNSKKQKSKSNKKKKAKKDSKTRSKSKERKQMSAIVTHLTNQISNLQGSVKKLEKEKNDWQQKANQLSTFYFGALKELKNAFYEFRDKSLEEQNEIQKDFNSQLQKLLVKRTKKSDPNKSKDMVIEENPIQDESIAKLMDDSVIENRFKRKQNEKGVNDSM